MKGRWKFFLFGILLFQWVQVAVFWHLMDVIRYQAEGSWLHETAWGPETMSWIWTTGGIVTALSVVLLVADVLPAIKAAWAVTPEDPKPR
jgi:hypothetical protein